MASVLLGELDDLEKSLVAIEAALKPYKAEEWAKAFFTLTSLGKEILLGRDLLAARAACVKYEKDLHAVVSEGRVQYGSQRIAFHLARLLSVESHVSVNWALADKIATYAGAVFSYRSARAGVRTDLSFYSTFLDKKKPAVASFLWHPIRKRFGWPVAISYAVRNLFVHAGGGENKWLFFEGTDPTSGFRISSEGVRYLEESCVEKEIEQSMCNVPEQAPWHKGDLRETLSICDRETDHALRMVTASATMALKQAVGHLTQ